MIIRISLSLSIYLVNKTERHMHAYMAYSQTTEPIEYISLGEKIRETVELYETVKT